MQYRYFYVQRRIQTATVLQYIDGGSPNIRVYKSSVYI
jgi:hypothetical protein